ncbi:MAG: hypothetical protein P4N60_22635 [Verrucomicrobiae bacterium]|nr:hypothetical protein [Verrucomicrobiae bacterium]
MTLIELLVIIFVLALLASMIGVPTSTDKIRAKQLSCMNNLKQTGLAERVWAGDNHDKYPMEISTTNGGTMELVDGPDAWKTFLVMSNELGTPKVVFCPSDLQRTNASGFGPAFSAKNISYFIGADATVTNGNVPLFGDNNFLINTSPVKPGLIEVKSGSSIAWDSTRHTDVKTHAWFDENKKGGGNVVLGDALVVWLTNSNLLKQFTQTGLATNRLVIP